MSHWDLRPPRPAAPPPVPLRPLRGRARHLALAWVIGVVALYVAVRVFGLELVR